MRELAWGKYSEQECEKVFQFGEDFRKFLSDYKTEREQIKGYVELAEQNGYKDLKKYIETKTPLKAGDKVYYNNMGKMLLLFYIGKEPLEKGLRIAGAHVDASRLDLKPYPLYETDGLAYFDTHYYGGFKPYLWQARPLAIHGIVCKTDGRNIEFVIGEDEKDPVIGLSDLLPHLSKDLNEKKASEVMPTEKMDLFVGSIPVKDDVKDKVKETVLRLLKEQYDIDEEDFTSAEVEIVPAGPARHYGLDNSMVLAYGQDDRVCGYTSFRGMMEVKDPDKTCVTLLVDKEEIGSYGPTGMQSACFENTLAEIMELLGDYSELKVRRCLANSKMLSTDVTAAYDPNYAEVYEKRNAAYFGMGFCFSKYVGARGKSGSNDANPEYVAKVKAIMEKYGVSYQFAELGKVDQGGGGTISWMLAKYNMEVIDCGVPVHSMHAPFEITSKADIYETMRGNYAFFSAM